MIKSGCPALRNTALEKYSVLPSGLTSTPMLTVAVVPDNSILGGPDTLLLPDRAKVAGWNTPLLIQAVVDIEQVESLIHRRIALHIQGTIHRLDFTLKDK